MVTVLTKKAQNHGMNASPHSLRRCRLVFQNKNKTKEKTFMEVLLLHVQGIYQAVSRTDAEFLGASLQKLYGVFRSHKR